jgi:hypothetical protein
MRLRERAGILLLFVTCSALIGCGGAAPPRVFPELPDASAASKAMELHDTNHDGFLDAKELEKVPGLKAALKQVDTDRDGKVSQQEIADRIKSWADSRAGRVPIRLRITRNGRPLVGAKVVFVPEKFLGANMKSGTGTTSETGSVYASSPTAANSKVYGLSPGFYRVEITKDGETIPARYNTETTLGVEASRDYKPADLSFDLK